MHTLPHLHLDVLQHILQHSREAILVVSASDMNLVEINRRACDIIGCVREDVLGTNLSNIECSLLDIFFWEELRMNPIAKPEFIAESEWLSRSGDVIPIEKRVSQFCHHQEHFWIIHAEELNARRQVEHEQMQLASQLQSSLEATAEGILSVNLNGELINLNKRFAAMWQFSDDIMVERDANHMMEQILACLEAPDEFRHILERIRAFDEDDTENSLRLKDGRHVICVSKPEYSRDRLVGRVFSMRDITAMKRVENDLVNALALAENAVKEKTATLEALKFSESRLRRLINSSLIGIFQGNMSGQLTVTNDVFLRLLGVSTEDLIGEHVDWLDLTSIAYRRAHKAALLELQEHGQVAPFEAEFLRSDGSKVPVMVGLASLEGSQFEWVGFVLDLSEQKKADRIKSEFVSVVSHELRTPLTSIRGALGLLESGALGALTPNMLNLVQIAYRNSQRLGNLVNDILDIEKLASGKMDLRADKLDIQKLAAQAIEGTASYAAEFSVHYALAAQSTDQLAVGDAERITQVFANLLSNAAKFSPKGEAVEVRVSKVDDFIRVEVQDKGPGIPDEFRDRIFSKFAQADGSDTRRQGGTGLGLNISKSFVEKMGGSIGFDSEVGRGSLFWFTLPCAK